MFTKFTSIIGAAAIFASSALAAGNAYVTNDCSYPVFVQHVDQVGQSSVMQIAPGGYYRESISSNPGVALKVWASADQSQPLSELDYTLTTTGNYQGLFWSLGGSGNSSPFTPTGYGVIPSNGGGQYPTCGWTFCSAGVQNCPNFGQIKVCPISSDLNLYVCSG